LQAAAFTVDWVLAHSARMTVTMAIACIKGYMTYSSAPWWPPYLHSTETRESWYTPEYKTKQKFWYSPTTSATGQYFFRITDRNNSNICGKKKKIRHKVICEGSKLNLQGIFSPQNKPLLAAQMTAPGGGNGCYKLCLFSA